ncbi:MAG: ribose 5-phosphate isomerase B [Holosporales bacterium]|jgi:ribose 5-phosphate isomerase B|nr:ribose 5-phosphate isomerase B [Holosporales bacterium]
MIFTSAAIACDHRGYILKASVVAHLESILHEVRDFSPSSNLVSVDYPDYVRRVVECIHVNSNFFGILICNSGIGMSIAANRFKGIRAVNCHTKEEAKLSREHNNSNVICLGAGFISDELALKCIDVFISKEFSDERHLKRIKKIDELC